MVTLLTTNQKDNYSLSAKKRTIFGIIETGIFLRQSIPTDSVAVSTKRTPFITLRGLKEYIPNRKIKPDLTPQNAVLSQNQVLPLHKLRQVGFLTRA